MCSKIDQEYKVQLEVIYGTTLTFSAMHGVNPFRSGVLLSSVLAIDVVAKDKRSKNFATTILSPVLHSWSNGE